MRDESFTLKQSIMLKIKIPFGYKTIQLDNLLTIYTGKIRIKADITDLNIALQKYQEYLTFTVGKSYCTTITFCTTNNILKEVLMHEINSVLADIMHKRIDQKYRGAKVFNSEMIENYIAL